jgi:hypothetical protein
VPGLNQESAWQTRITTRQEGRPVFGTCHRFPMTSIGAERVAVRRYADAGSPGTSSPATAPRAANMVATFADEKTAKRAYAVLEAWRSQCDELLADRVRPQVGRPRVLQETGDVSAAWYLLRYGPVPGDREAAYFDAQGMARVGDHISVLTMRVAGQDYNYEPGSEPMVAAVRASVTELSG